MNKLQINIIRSYLLITLLLVGFGLFIPANRNLWLFRYFSILSLFLIAIYFKVKRKIQTQLPYALLFAAIGDAFIYLPLSLNFLKLNIPLGLFSFTMAYVIIASTYLKVLSSNHKSGNTAFNLLQIALIVVIVSISVIFLQKTQLDYLFFGSLFLFALLLVFSCSLNIFFTPLISKRLRGLILISSTLMVICDTGVILGFSIPAGDPMVYNLGSSMVWSAYIPAWTIICILSMDTEYNKTNTLNSLQNS
ncbi:MAG: hypothetical protein WBI17_00045 [Clostridiaceae bacterium]